nr:MULTISPECIES: hypothetical protein [Hyphomicrobiales]
MAKRPRHPDKHVEEAVAYAEGKGWRFVKGENHCWGRLFCAHATREGCRISVYSTPTNPFNHAKAIKRTVDKCDHEEGDDANA